MLNLCTYDFLGFVVFKNTWNYVIRTGFYLAQPFIQHYTWAAKRCTLLSKLTQFMGAALLSMGQLKQSTWILERISRKRNLM